MQHVIVGGCGRVGAALTAQLVEAGHTVAIIDKRPDAFRRLVQSPSVERVNGLVFDRDTLRHAGIERASAFAAVTSGDNSNIVAARIAKETFQLTNVVARIYDPARASVYARLGIATVATVAWTTDQVIRRLLDRRVSDWTDQSGQLSLIEQSIPLPWCGRRLADLNRGTKWQIVGVSRAGASQLVTDTLMGQEGDVLHLMVHASGLVELDERLRGVEGDRP